MRGQSARAWFAFTVGFAALAGLPACSVVVAGETPFQCEPGEPDPCPPNYRCQRNLCTPEPCDLDGDGWGCGETPDCADDDPNIHPMATEVCDGIDNDCNGSDDPPCPSGLVCRNRGPGQPYMCLRSDDCLTGDTVCTEAQRCDAASGQCVDRTATDCRTTACSAPNECDTLTGLCFMPRPLGASCMRDLECETNVCFPAAALERGQTGGVCSKPCCNDEACADVSGTCRATGTGARGCVPRIATAPACANENQCTSTCRLGPDRTFACTGMLATGNREREPCMNDEDCYSGYCLESTCAVPCASATDCNDEEACRLRNARTFLSPSWVTVCTTPSGPGAQGTQCRRDDDCAERYCHTQRNPQYCANVCCSDDHCGRGFVCRPIEHNGYELRCIRG